MSITVNVTGVSAAGYAGAYDLLLLQSGGFLLLEDGGRVLTSAGSEVQGHFLVTGVSATGEVGDAQTIYGARVPVEGVFGVGRVGVVFLWNDVRDAQNPNWTGVVDWQNPNWTVVNDPSSPNWTNIL